MGCLFCDQAPESVTARKDFAKVAELLNCRPASVIRRIQELLYNLASFEAVHERMTRERDHWRAEANRLQEMLYGRAANQLTPPWVMPTEKY